MDYKYWIVDTTNHKAINDYDSFEEADEDLMYFKVFSKLNTQKGLHFVIKREDELHESILECN